MASSSRCLAALFFSIFSITGCAYVETLGDFINDNELLTSMAARKAVGRYIAAGETLEEERERAQQVEVRLQMIALYVEGNPKANADGLLDLIDHSINWGDLERSDRVLVKDIVELLRVELLKHNGKTSLSDTTKIALKGLLDTAISAARVYLMRV